MMAGGAVNFFQPGTEAAVDANSILRQRKMAELLMQQSQQGQQSQMVSGHYVAPSKLSYVTQIAQALAGRYLGDQADSKEAELGHQLRQRNADEASQFTQAMQGTPARSEEMAGPPSPDGAMPSRQIAAVPGDQNRALAIALGGQNPQLQALAPEIIKRQMDAAELRSALQSAGIGAPAAPAAGGTDSSGVPPGGGAAAPSGLPDGISPQAFALTLARNPQAQALGKMIQEANKPQTLAEGGTLVTPGGKIIMTAPKTEAGISVQGGRAVPVPGFAEAQASRAGQVAAAESAARDPYGALVRIGDRWLTPAQARAEAQGSAEPLAGQIRKTPIDYVTRGGAEPPRDMRAIAQEQIRVMEGELKDPALTDADRAGIRREIARLGGPATTAAPGISVPNEASQAYATSRAKSYAEQAPKLQQAGQDAEGRLRQLSELENLYRDPNVAKGALAESFSGLKNIGASFGIDMKGLSSEQAAEAITNKMALYSRSTAEGSGMPGAMSDADRKFLVNMQPGLSKTPEGRAKIIDTARRLTQRQVEVAKLAREYEQANGQLDIGFDRVLADYASKNQMFRPAVDWSKAKIERVR